MRQVWLAPLAMLLLTAPVSPTSAQAPSASVEERLIRLEEGQRSIEKRFDDMNRKIDQRFDDLNRKVDERFADLNHRVGDLIAYIQMLVTILAAVGIGIFGTLLLMWRRLVKVEADVALLTNQSRVIRTP